LIPKKKYAQKQSSNLRESFLKEKRNKNNPNNVDTNSRILKSSQNFLSKNTQQLRHIP
jgi:hypothetical protein